MIGVIGLEYVGLPLAVEAGPEVIAVHVDVEDIPTQRLAAVRDHTTPASITRASPPPNAVRICVPTPLTPNREPDLGPLLGASRALAEIEQRDQLIVLESTIYPRPTRAQVQQLLEARGLKVGQDIYLDFSRERVDPGRTDYRYRLGDYVV